MRPALAFALALAVASACADLPQIERNTCGNFVLESGEDCDTPKADPFVCRVCKYDCSATPCPTGFGCGSDFVCRKPSGNFATAVGPEIPVDARRLEVGDFDGDRHEDIVAETTAEFRVHFFDGRGDPTRTFSVLGASPHAVCSLGSKSLATLATSSDDRVSVWRGQSDRTLATTLYPSLAIAGMITQARVFVTDVLPASAGSPFVQDEYMTALTFGAGSLLTLGQFDPMKQPLFTWAAPLDKVVGPVFEHFNVFQNCNTMVFAYAGTTEIRSFTLCKGNLTNTGSGILATVATHNPSRIIAGDINQDGNPDIAIQSTTQVDPEIAFGTGFGTFTATTALVSPKIRTTLLAVGDVDGDGQPDWVESNGLRLSTMFDNIGIPAVGLTQAIVRDANDDGSVDVIAIGTGGVTFVFGSSSSVLTPSFRALDGTPKFLLVSDFDGDRIQDILVSTDLGDSANLWVQWGRERQFPEPPVFVGSLAGSRIEDLSGGIIAPFLGGIASGAAIAPLLSRRTDTNQLEAPVLLGSASRVLQSPFVIGKNDLQGRVVGVVPGRFSGGDHEGLAFVAQDLQGIDHPFRLWTVPSTGDAQLDPGQLLRAGDPLDLAKPPIVDPNKWDLPLAAAIDLEDDGIDELVMLAPPEATASGKQGALVVARGIADGTFQTTSQDVGMGLRGPWTLHAGDLDGDGRKDIVLRFTDSPNHYVLRLLMNKGDGKLDLASAIPIVLPGLDTPQDVAMLRTDPASARRTLAIAGTERIYLVPWTASGLGGMQALGASGATSIAAGDIDGDGVDDLVIGRQGTVTVWFQHAVGEK